MPGATRTLLDWFLRRHPDTPKTRAKQFILAGRVSVDGCVIRKPHHALADPGDRLELLGRHATSLSCGKGWQIHPRVSLVHLDTALAVLNKGPGLISVPDGDHLSAMSVLADFLAGKLRSRDPQCAGKSLPPEFRKLTPLPVHRLDQYTSGVFCVAFNPEARARLIDQLRRHEMKREYLAYVEGRPATRSGTWRNWLELSEDDSRQNLASADSAGGPTRAEAITHFEVLAEYRVGAAKAPYAKLRLRLETGLKHQIRIQALQAGVPLVGDRTYNSNYRPGAAPALAPCERQALHAETLKFLHPLNPQQSLSWQAELPKDLRQLEDLLRRGSQ